MPARSRTGGPQSVASTNSDEPEKDDVAYKLKRKRNNDAVKKTRAKSKETAGERKQNVQLLRVENCKLEATIEQMKHNMNSLKDLLLDNVPDEDKEKRLKQILEEETDNDDE